MDTTLLLIISTQLADLLIPKETDLYGTVRPSTKDMLPRFGIKKSEEGRS